MYFRLRYTKQRIAVLNNVVRTRGKIRTLKFSAAFLKACISKRVAPKYIVARIERSRARHSPEMERAFLTDDVEKLTEQSRKLQTINQSHWRAAHEFLTFFDTIRFYRYLALLEERTKSKWKNKNERLLALLRRDRFGNALGDTTRHVLNLSDYVLSDTESFVLSHGLNFGLPPRHLCKEEIFAEFESLWAQLLHPSASSVEQRTALKARLADLAHLYCDSTIDSRDFTMHKECFRAINRLRKNDHIIVTKPDKGSGVVLLNKSDYVDKMNKILDDQSKFRRLGPVSSNDNTAIIESRLQKRLLDLVKADLMPKWIHDAIRPTGSQRPRMYRLPKTRKEGTTLRPILSMTGSSHHELGKWLASLLQPVLERFSSHCISHSFTFATTMQNLDIDLMSSCVLLMYPACSPTFTLMKPSKSVRKPSTTSLIPDQSFQRTCLLN